jgi:zinc protease
VVKNERRQRIENRPMGLVNRVLLEALYPPSHPYHHEVIGSMEDLSRASLDDVKAFFHRYYAPSNASLVLVGDFDPARARTLIEQYFGPIPSGLPAPTGGPAAAGASSASPGVPAAGVPAPRPAPAPVTLHAETRIALEAKVQQPQVFIDYPTPRSLSEGDHAMDVSAQILAGGKASRLYKRLVYDLQIAQSVSAHQQSQLLQSVFEISATPIAGHTLDELVRVIDEEVEALRTKPVEPGELERAKNQIEFDTFRSLEAPLAQAERLQTYNLQVGDPGYLTRDIEMYRAVDAAAVQSAAAQYLRKDGRVVVTVTPNADAPIMGRVKPQ